MTADQASRLADVLMGMDDAKQNLVDAYLCSQKGDPSKHTGDMMEAGERWLSDFDKLSDFLEKEFER